MNETAGRAFRDAWIQGVRSHYPGEPKAGYVSPWEEMPDWERQSAAAVFEQVRHFLAVTDGAAKALNRTQKSQFVALCWVGQIFMRIPDPKATYVANWANLPEWQKETDADIFEAIETLCEASASVAFLSAK